MKETQASPTAQSAKPKWLKKLEAESWQAEMIVSGVAIFGSLQLPGLIYDLIDYQVYELPETLMWPAFFINVYLFIGSLLLIVGFLAHFILRALWIGMVGFNSVFPKGIQRNTQVLSEAFLDRLIEDYGDVNGYIKRLDNVCSSLFAFAFSAAYTMVAISISILVLLLIAYGVHYLLPQYSVLQILAVLGGVLFVFAMVNSLFAIKALRESDFAKRWQYPVAMTFNRVMYNFAARPVLIIQYTALTGSDMKRYLGAVAGIAFIAIFTVSPILTKSRTAFLLQKVYWRYGGSPGTLRTSAYANTLEDKSLLLAPLLESDEIADNRSVWVFVPLPERELSLLEEQCTQPEVERGDLSNLAYRQLQAERFAQCADAYLDFSLNGRPLPAAAWYRFNYPNRGEYGAKVYFEDLPAVPGENLLTITHGYRNEDGEPRVTALPFRYLGPAPRDSVSVNPGG